MLIKSIPDVVRAQLCTGCGVCAYVEPRCFRMGDSLDYGRRPFSIENSPGESGEAFNTCPGVRLEHDKDRLLDADLNQELLSGWGPVYAVWEGYAADSELRYAGSSGGAISGLALYCIEQEDMAGVLHTAARKDFPHLNETVFSSSRDELLDRAGSRYSPSSPAEGLGVIERASKQCVFVGKPCDAAAVANASKRNSLLSDKLGLVVAFFCAGVPSTTGTLDLLGKVASGAKEIKALRYRGLGWPGMWTAQYVDAQGAERIAKLTYADSWGFLQKYRQWRCYICPDHTGEFADVAIGDPWYRDIDPNEPGKSLIVARTRRGLETVKAAAAKGYIVLEEDAPQLLPKSQPNLLVFRGMLWPRLWVLRVLGAGCPRFNGFPMFRFWMSNLSWKAKVQSILSTIKRVFTKGLRRSVVVSEHK